MQDIIFFEDYNQNRDRFFIFLYLLKIYFPSLSWCQDEGYHGAVLVINCDD